MYFTNSMMLKERFTSSLSFIYFTYRQNFWVISSQLVYHSPFLMLFDPVSSLYPPYRVTLAEIATSLFLFIIKYNLILTYMFWSFMQFKHYREKAEFNTIYLLPSLTSVSSSYDPALHLCHCCSLCNMAFQWAVT